MDVYRICLIAQLADSQQLSHPSSVSGMFYRGMYCMKAHHYALVIYIVRLVAVLHLI